MLMIFIISDSLTSILFKSNWKLEGNHKAKELRSSSEEEEK